MADNEVTLAEVWRGMQRIESDISDIKRENIHRSELAALQKDVERLQDTQKWVARTAGGALLLALMEPVLRLIGA